MGGRWFRIRGLVCGAALAAAVTDAPIAWAGPAEDRLEVMELMDRYGQVHDFGTPQDYADLFTSDGEIAVGDGPPVVKGREALIAQARRDHEKYVAPTGRDGKSEFFMRHLITDRVVTLTGHRAAEGSCYVVTLVNDPDAGPVILSFGRYVDTYRKVDGAWRIARRRIQLDFGNRELGRKLGFR